MKPENYAKTVQAELGAEAVIAVRPDHPFLFVGPDVLIGRRGQLLAVFFPKSFERRSPDSLLVRLAVSRLGLPSHTRTLVIVESSEASGSLARALALAFAQTEAEYKALAATLALLADDRSTLEAQRFLPGIPAEVRQATHTRGHLLLEETRVREALFAEAANALIHNKNWPQRLGFEPAEIPSWSFEKRRQRAARRGQIFMRGDIIAAMPTLAPGGSVLTQLRPLLEAGIKIRHELVAGVPMPARETVNCLLLRDFPIVWHDPLKAARAAAFAGWVILPQHLIEKLDETCARIRARLEEVSGE